MDTIQEYLETIKHKEHAKKLDEVITWVQEKYPQLKLKIAWNQPMFIDHETFIIGFSVASKHLAIAPEVKILQNFTNKIAESGYTYGKNIFRIEWDAPVDYTLLKEIIQQTIEIKKDCTTFWLK